MNLTRQQTLRLRISQIEHLEDRRLLSVTMTDQEQLLLELVNRARANPLAEAARFGIDLNHELAPGTISPDPKQPLAPEQSLTDAAQDYAQWMLDHDFFGHNTPPPNSTSPSDRARAAGYTGSVGENIAYQGRSSDFSAAERDELVYKQHEVLFLSHGHRENLLYPSHRELGTGVRFGIFDSLEKGPLFTIMVAEEFGSRGGEYFLTGVAYNDQVEANNFYEIGEGLGNVTVTAVRNGGLEGESYVTTTGPSGGYSLQVPNGTYQVTAQGEVLAEPLVLSNVIISGQNEKVDFNTLSWSTGAIGGIVFNDENSDGIQQAGEAPLADRTVFLDSNGNGQLDADEASVVTNANGSFLFNGLRPDDYRVVLEIPNGWQATSGNAGILEVALDDGTTSLGHRFGLFSANVAPVVLADTFTFRQATVATLDVLQNDVDPDGDLTRATFELVTAPQRGVVNFDATDATASYTPQPTYVGSDSFSYRIRDERGGTSGVAQVTLQILNDNTAPFQNAANLFDVNGSGSVSPLDTMAVINEINRFTARLLPESRAGSPQTQHVDVNGDGYVSAIDALLVLVAISRSIQMREDILLQQGSVPSATQAGAQTESAVSVSMLPVAAAAPQSPQAGESQQVQSGVQAHALFEAWDRSDSQSRPARQRIAAIEQIFAGFGRTGTPARQ